MYTDGITRTPYSVVLCMQFCICYYRCNSSTRIIRRFRRAWLRRLVDLYRRQFTRYGSLAAEVIAPFVHLHVFSFPPSCIGLSGIIGHYVLHILYDIVKDKSLEYRSGRSPGEHLATLVAR